MTSALQGLKSIAVTSVPGDVAGAHTVDGGLHPDDTLLSVRHVSADLTTTNADLTAEFSISALNTIDNSAGTDTTGDFLVVTYAKARP